MKRCVQTTGLVLALLLGVAPAAAAQTEGPGVLSPAWLEQHQLEMLLGLVGLTMLLVLVCLAVVYMAVRAMFASLKEEQGADAWVSPWARLMQRLTQAVPIEKEHEIVKHEYDGIVELDNKLPPWWVAMFYLTIVFGVGYLVYYEVLDGPSSAEEYAMQMAEAEAEVQAYLASMEEQIDETNVLVLTEEGRLLAGQELFEKNCMACHGQYGQGLVGLGPNLTDDYWLHGGDVKSMFTTVKYGVKATSMIAWGKQLTPAQMQNVVSYVYTLHGTDPAGAKEPEGERFERNPADDYGEAEAPTEEETDSDTEEPTAAVTRSQEVVASR